ncbi:hypothetical protein [Brachyspira aalborgi]|nr:hypothetical protein [Brachyspira aalborgi]
MNNINFEDITVVVQGTMLENKDIREVWGKTEDEYTKKNLQPKLWLINL